MWLYETARTQLKHRKEKGTLGSSPRPCTTCGFSDVDRTSAATFHSSCSSCGHETGHRVSVRTGLNMLVEMPCGAASGDLLAALFTIASSPSPFSLCVGGFVGFFKRYGNVSEAFLVKERGTGRHRGFGFITFGALALVSLSLTHNFILNFECIRHITFVENSEFVLGLTP